MHLALGQVPVILGNVNQNLKIMEDSILEAKTKSKEDIDLIAFPELFITGYNLKDNTYKPLFEATFETYQMVWNLRHGPTHCPYGATFPRTNWP